MLTLVARGYTFANWYTFGIPGQCYSEVQPGVILTYQTSNDRKEWDPTTLTANTTTSVLAIHVNGWIFAAETGSSDSSQQNSTSSCPTDSGSLSTGDAVGIGVGVGLGVVGLATLAIGIFMMRRSRMIQRRTQTAPRLSTRADPRSGQRSYGPHSELESHGGYGSYGTGVGDVRYKAPPSELPSEES
jgi:hypothetical protein